MAQCMLYQDVKVGKEIIVRGVSYRFDEDSARDFNNFVRLWKRQDVMPADTTTISIPRTNGSGRVDVERGQIYRALL